MKGSNPNIITACYHVFWRSVRFIQNNRRWEYLLLLSKETLFFSPVKACLFVLEFNTDAE